MAPALIAKFLAAIVLNSFYVRKAGVLENYICAENVAALKYALEIVVFNKMELLMVIGAVESSAVVRALGEVSDFILRSGIRCKSVTRLYTMGAPIY